MLSHWSLMFWTVLQSYTLEFSYSKSYQSIPHLMLKSHMENWMPSSHWVLSNHEWLKTFIVLEERVNQKKKSWTEPCSHSILGQMTSEYTWEPTCVPLWVWISVLFKVYVWAWCNSEKFICEWVWQLLGGSRGYASGGIVIYHFLPAADHNCDLVVIQVGFLIRL